MNKVILQGRLVADPENRTGANDTVICRFTVAVDHYNAREGEKSAIFVPCIMFGQRADVFGHYTHKGDRVLIEGRIDITHYENEDGEKRTYTNVVAEQFEFIHNVKTPQPEAEEKKTSKYSSKYKR